ncbi:MAG: Rrf2 family transcriptional regulator [Acidimicrobiales bacterium]|jgi:Rrf2 family protein|nr:Rrf2 family transcriptional regulator [Acidimicrobiales bacterium]
MSPTGIDIPAPLHVTVELDYAVRALTALAAGDRTPRTVHRLAGDGMSVAFLQQVLGRLRHAGLVGARRGTGGGYWLRRPPEGISVGDVVRALHPEPTLPPGPPGCGIDALWLALGSQVRDRLDATTIADLA